MKILLITLPREGQLFNWLNPEDWEKRYSKGSDKTNKYIPLGILSIATNLPKEYDVKILDPGENYWTIEQTIQEIENEKPDVLGISAITRRVYPLYKILTALKGKIPYIAVGGPHVTFYSEQILKWGADAAFLGSLADQDFAEAVKTYKKGVIICKTDINKIKYPNRELIDYKSYFPIESRYFVAENRMVMFSSIGCPNKCNFCNVQSRDKLIFKNPEIVVDEMEYLGSLHTKSIHILDDNFNVSRKHVSGILDEMDKRDFKFEWSSRGQTKMDFSLLPKLEEHGLKRLHVGIEALDDNILKFFNKNETVKDVYKFCEELNKTNIDMFGYFIIGSPIETREYIKSLPQRIKDLNIKYQLINVLFPEPNTKYYDDLVKSGIYKRDYWKEYMENPVPDYVIPYPYGKERHDQLWSDVLNIADELKN